MSDKIELELVTPQKLAFSGAVDLVEVPGVEGDMGVLPEHAPVNSQLRPGVVEVIQGDKATRVFVSGGVVEVRAERCTILAKEALSLSEVKATDVKTRLSEAERAHSKATNENDKILAEADLEVAEALVAALELGR